jgi:hypothetical protein
MSPVDRQSLAQEFGRFAKTGYKIVNRNRHEGADPIGFIGSWAVAAFLAKAKRIAVSLRGAAKSISKFKECFGKPDPDSAAAASPSQPK